MQELDDNELIRELRLDIAARLELLGMRLVLPALSLPTLRLEISLSLGLEPPLSLEPALEPPLALGLEPMLPFEAELPSEPALGLDTPLVPEVMEALPIEMVLSMTGIGLRLPLKPLGLRLAFVAGLLWPEAPLVIGLETPLALETALRLGTALALEKPLAL
jgi:hypothetical protein